MNPYTLDAKQLETSFCCFNQHFGKFLDKECLRYNNELTVSDNLKLWSNYLDKRYMEKIEYWKDRDYKIGGVKFDPFVLPTFMNNELVIHNKEGVNFDQILSKNSEGITIVVKREDLDKNDKKLLRKLKRKYSQYEWIVV